MGAGRAVMCGCFFCVLDKVKILAFTSLSEQREEKTKGRVFFFFFFKFGSGIKQGRMEQGQEDNPNSFLKPVGLS